MENNPFNNNDEEDKAKAAKAELDDDKKKDKDKKKAPRHAPGISFEKVKPEAERKEKKRLSITDRFLESIGAKPEKKLDTDDEVTTNGKEDEEKPAIIVEPDGPTVFTEENTVSINTKATVIVPESVKKPAEKASDSTILEAADWESEEPAGNVERAPSLDTEVNAPEAQEEFAEIPTIVEAADDIEVEPVEPELLATGIGSEGPPKPPEIVPDTPEADEPEPVPSPRAHVTSLPLGGGASGGWGGNASPSPWYNAAAADRARLQELDDAENEGRRAGIRRGLGAGLLFGWMFGRHGKKKQAKAFEKQLKTNAGEIKELKTEQTSAAERLEAVKRTQERLHSNMQQHETSASKGPENSSQKPTVIEVATATAALKALERSTASMRANEKIHQVADGRRVETSAWHRIEIDKNTGKVVKNPGIAYGKEFRSEQKEVYKDGTSDSYYADKTEKDNQKKVAAFADSGATSNSATQLGGLAAASYTQDNSTYDSENQESGLSAGLPYQETSKDHSSGSKLLRFAATPIIWVVAIVVVIVLFVVGVLR